jgi:hypothetical protein
MIFKSVSDIQIPLFLKCTISPPPPSSKTKCFRSKTIYMKTGHSASCSILTSNLNNTLWKAWDITVWHFTVSPSQASGNKARNQLEEFCSRNLLFSHLAHELVKINTEHLNDENKSLPENIRFWHLFCCLKSYFVFLKGLHKTPNKLPV